MEGFSAQSQSISGISAAILKAQRLIGGAEKGKANPFFKSKYADYGSVLEACKDHLNANGITVLQPILSAADGDFVITTLLHESGEYVSSKIKVVVAKQNDPQAYGSAITYARRYGLQSFLSIPAEDDDAERAMERTPAPAKAIKSHIPDSGTLVFVPNGLNFDEKKGKYFVFDKDGHCFSVTKEQYPALAEAKTKKQSVSLSYEKSDNPYYYNGKGMAVIGG